MMRRSLLASVALAALTAVLGAYAGEPTKGGGKSQPPVTVDEKGRPVLDQAGIAAKQKELGEKFSAFEKQLLTLQQRLANSSVAKDRERAAQLKKVLETVGDRDPTKKFAIMVKMLTETKIAGTLASQMLVKQSLDLAKDLKEILDLLKSADGVGSRKEERLALEALKKELDKVIRDEKLIRNKIGNKDNDGKAIAGDQSDTTNDTAKLEKKFGKDGKGGDGGEAADNKGKAKDGGKGEKGDGKATNKDGEGSKSGDSKDGGKGDGKKGSSKDGAKGSDGGKEGGKDGKGEAKDGKGADGAKAGAGKDGQGGGKEAGKDKGGDGSKAGAGK